MSAPNEHAGTTIPVSAGRLLPDGRRVYRLVTLQVVWWAWVTIAVFSLGDLVIQGHDYLSLKFALGLLMVTGLVFACTIWPTVIAHDDGLTVRNPLRVFEIPWDAVRGIFLADSVEIQCARGPKKKDKTVYSWALSSARRGRAKARMHGGQWEQGRRSRPSSYSQLPGQAKELIKMTPTEVIAREMAKMSEQAKAETAVNGVSPNGASPPAASGLELAGAGAADGSRGPEAASGDVVMSRWAWPALAAILVPGIAFAISLLVG